MDLNTILIILGVLALVILVAHGLWSNRREKTQFFKNANTFTRDGRIEHHSQNSGHDPLTGVPVQRAAQLHNQEVPLQTTSPIQQPVISQEVASQPVQQGLNFDEDISEVKRAPHYEYPSSSSKSVEQAVNEIKISLPGETMTQESNPVYTMPVTQGENLGYRSIADIEAQVDENEGINTSSTILREQLAQASQTAGQATNYTTEPSVTRQPTMDAPAASEPMKKAVNETPDFVVLYVVSPENREFYGSHLALALEELGFVFSEEGIFNRHVDTVATPVVYSVANIRQPGTFDLGAMAEFSTIGIVFFMQLSSTAKDRMNFLYMYQDAKQLAERLGGFVLDEEQELFTEETKTRYLTRFTQY
ncbi:cell division protein ZipA [Conservatibacter flavescens]|uniref:Cell division protein ZipA n=1 Tax=Conservatibacter flavescens TaxID=28161 RepID=A0A2M8S1N4_9PAST|nr:cell division protein ZipA [Conservatibacter flavescens]PJG85062.1 cell division protein ZipA [Conservatibacter flavescens]